MSYATRRHRRQPEINLFKMWPNEGIGRYWKRRLSKARRRAWRDEHERGLAGTESTVNYRTW